MLRENYNFFKNVTTSGSFENVQKIDPNGSRKTAKRRVRIFKRERDEIIRDFSSIMFY